MDNWEELVELRDIVRGTVEIKNPDLQLLSFKMSFQILLQIFFLGSVYFEERQLFLVDFPDNYV